MFLPLANGFPKIVTLPLFLYLQQKAGRLLNDEVGGDVAQMNKCIA